MTLYIDTTNFDSITYALKSGGKIVKKVYKVLPHESFKTLEKLNDFLKQSKILNPQSEILNLVVNKGPGSYTGTRIGVTHAQALGFAWGVPVKFVSAEKFEIGR